MNKLLPKRPAGDAGDPPLQAPARLLFADHIRIAAIFAVVVLHASTGVVMGYGRIDPWEWLAGNVANSASRWGVPVFAMLSGALLLCPGKEESLRIFFSKRVKRILLPLIFWSSFCYGWYRMGGGEAMTFGGAVRRVVLESHLYYLFILAAIYCITPWIRLLWRGGRTLPLFFLAAGAMNALAFYFHASAEIRPGLLLIHFFFFATGFIGYFTAGQYLLRVPVSPRTPPLALGLFVASSAVTAAGTFFLAGIYGPGKAGLYLYDYFSPPVMVMSVAVFMFIRAAAGPHLSCGGGARASAVRMLADSSFGVYLMHPFIQDALRRCGVWQGRDCLSEINPWLGIPLYSAAVYCICVAMTVLIRRTSLIRAVVGG